MDVLRVCLSVCLSVFLLLLLLQTILSGWANYLTVEWLRGPQFIVLYKLCSTIFLIAWLMGSNPNFGGVLLVIMLNYGTVDVHSTPLLLPSLFSLIKLHISLLHQVKYSIWINQNSSIQWMKTLSKRVTKQLPFLIFCSHSNRFLCVQIPWPEIQDNLGKEKSRRMSKIRLRFGFG